MLDSGGDEEEEEDQGILEAEIKKKLSAEAERLRESMIRQIDELLQR